MIYPYAEDPSRALDAAVADLLSDALQAVSTSSVAAMAAPPKRANLRVIRLSPWISLTRLLASVPTDGIR